MLLLYKLVCKLDIFNKFHDNNHYDDVLQIF